MPEAEPTESMDPSPKSSDATSLCLLCNKELRIGGLAAYLERYPICDKCFESLEPKMLPIKIGPYHGYRLYPYNEALQGAIYAFKGCRDYALKDVFITHQSDWIRLLFRSYTIVPAPSAKEHDEKRGYNHIVEIFGGLGLPMAKALIKTEPRKQSDLSSEERKEVKKILWISDPNSVRGKKVLFVDDVMTTGSTALASMDLLKEAGAKKISFLVLGRVELDKTRKK